MYNLIVTADSDAWNGTAFEIEVGRSLREYIDQDIQEKFGSFSDSHIRKIKKLPCIFAYESGVNRNPKIGWIKSIQQKTRTIRLEYEIIDAQSFISWETLDDILVELDIARWEMSRTHWTIKNVDLQKILLRQGIALPRLLQGKSKQMDITKHVFDVALSFPGEIRGYVESIAKELEKIIGPNSYFYDNNYLAQLARPSLDTLLMDIYGNRSKLIIVFLCTKYQEKDWCGLEFRAIREKILTKEYEKIMYIKMDSGEVDGVLRTDGYIDGTKFTPSQIANFVFERIESKS